MRTLLARGSEKRKGEGGIWRRDGGEGGRSGSRSKERGGGGLG